ncbi:DNA polymerase sigma subunit [Apiospora marii]|uniref:polynucleotide adenylyltransferase n=1 Tax=Apiospora marii TaxID=335849 RepID=A0ABR1R5Y2_9PEZI
MSRYRPSSGQPPPPPPDGHGYGGAGGYGSSSQHSYRQPPPPPPSNGGDRYAPSHNSDPRFFRGGFSDLRRDTRSRDPRDDYRRDQRDDYRPPQGDFDFRVDRPSGVQDTFESYRPSYDSGRNGGRPDRSDRRYPSDGYRSQRNGISNGGRPPAPRGGTRYDRGGRGGNFRGRGGYQPRAVKKAADRELLNQRHDQNVEEMLGDASGRATYRDVDELSDSDEAAMEISDDSDAEPQEPVAKRARVSSGPASAAEDAAPRWSNPDPYTALPPPDETTRKKKDVVQLIRKARVEADSKKSTDPSEAADFISCDFSDAEDEKPNTSKNLPAQPRRRADNHANASSSSGPTNVAEPENMASSANLAMSSIPTHLHSHPGIAQLPPHLRNNPQAVAAAVGYVDHNAPKHDAIAAAAQVGQALPRRSAQAKPVDLTPSTALGSRKRTFDDQIKRPHAPLKKVTKMKTTGNIISEYYPVLGQDACPWPGLHKELVDFHEYVKPRDFEQRVREEVVNRLDKLVKYKWGDASIKAFGSFMSGLYLPTADMDLVICSQSFLKNGLAKYNSKNKLWQMSHFLEGRRVAYMNEIEVIASAKVPLLKYCDSWSGLKIDVSMEKYDGIRAIKTFTDWKEKYPAMPILVAVLKQFLCMRGLNEPVNGGIGGFSVICMVVHLLNQMPQVQSGSMIPEHHLGECLMEFLDYYGNRFNYEVTAICMNPPREVPKNEVSNLVYRNMDRLSIIDPNNPANDISGGSSNFAVIRRHFKDAYEVLQDRMDELSGSKNDLKTEVQGYSTILAPIFAGNYSSFKRQRDFLQLLDEEMNAPPPPSNRRPNIGPHGIDYNKVE